MVSKDSYMRNGLARFRPRSESIRFQDVSGRVIEML